MTLYEIKQLKWNILPEFVDARNRLEQVWVDIVDDDGAEVVTDIDRDAAESIVAAHNACIDMILENDPR